MNSLLPNFYQVCRLCLSELNGSCIPLFEDNSIATDHEKVNYCVKIKFCFSITVEEKDNLPTALCTTCMRDVDKFYSFKETVIRNNAYLNSCTCNRIHKTGDQQCKEKNNEKAVVSIQVKTKKDHGDKVNNVNNSDPIDRILQRTKGKIKVEMIPQVQDASFDSAQINGICDNSGIITNYEDRMDSTKVIKSEPISSDTELDLTNKINNRLDNVSDSSVKYIKSELLSPIHNGMISKSNDYSSINSSSIENTYYNLSTHSENFTDFESEDTKSVASDSYKDDLEDDQRLVIDEDCVVSEQTDNGTEFSNHNDGDNPNNELKSEDCILLRTLTNSSGSSQCSMNGSSATRKSSTSSSSPSSIKNEIQQCVSMYKQESSPNHSTSPSRQNSSHYQGSTRRKQKCPTKSTDVVNETDENVQDSVAAETLPIHQQIINISPVTVTCSSIPNDREEVIGFSQVQFLDEVLSRHSSPITTPPIIPLHAERLHKACDVLLRAASKIQDLPISMEESIGNGSPPTAHYEEIENNKPLPLHSTNSNKKSKSKDKLQNNIAQHKECSNCHAIQTTIWRRDRFGNIVCNACGLYYKLHNFDRPCRMRRDEIHKRNRKRTPGEKGKKSKCNQNASGINHSMTEQENSSSSYPGSCYETVITDVVYPVVENGVSSGKRRRRTSGSGGIKKSVNNRDEFIYYERDVPAQRSSSADSSSEMHHSGKKPLNDLYNRDKLKMITTAFQLSTHFMPINNSPTASLAANFSNSDSDDQIVSEAPLNLAAGGH